jgi:hypothetical protein
MTDTDRRSVLRGILSGAVVLASGAAAVSIGSTILPDEAEAVPLAVDKAGAAEIDDLVEKAQVVVVGPRRRRRRRRVCTWRRGRRVCVYRW